MVGLLRLVVFVDLAEDFLLLQMLDLLVPLQKVLPQFRAHLPMLQLQVRNLVLRLLRQLLFQLLDGTFVISPHLIDLSSHLQQFLSELVLGLRVNFELLTELVKDLTEITPA